MSINEKTQHLIFTLFATFFKIGCFTFGGGYAMVTVMQREVVEKYGWINDEEFVDMLAVTQSAPGPIAVNTSVFIGYKLAGLPGAVTALFGTILPSFLIILALAVWLTSQGETVFLDKFFKGLRPAVVALILGAGLGMGQKCMKSAFDISIGVVSFILLVLLGVHPVILLTGGAGLGIMQCRRFTGRQKGGA